MKLILGAGKTAKSITNFLDKKSIAFQIIKDTRELKNNDILQGIDEIFISPGIAQNQDIVIKAREKNIPITSDIELFGRYADKPIIGITGSNGKSSVTTMLGIIIKNAGVGGNIGIPALNLLDKGFDYYILEISSYQLDYTKNLKLLTAVVLNITPDHLDRYKNFDEYKKSKLSIYNYSQKPVFNLDEKHYSNGLGFGKNIPKNKFNFGLVTCHKSCYLLEGNEVLINADELKIIGKHNISNALAALAICKQIGINPKKAIKKIKDFKGLEHRLEYLGVKDKISYYNDSKSTNSIATITAINAIKNKYKNICLIAGGISKHEDYSELFSLINKKINSVILIGQDAKDLAEGISIPTKFANNMKKAVEFAKNSDSEAVLLSPACASFDMFDNFEHRGKEFKKYIS